VNTESLSPFTPKSKRIRWHQSFDIRVQAVQFRVLAFSYLNWPIRVVLRRRFSTYIASFDVPLYLVKCDNGLHEGYTSFQSSLGILRQVMPIWVERIKMLFKNIMIMDMVEFSSYFLADRCCIVNPWYAKKLNANPHAESVLLASYIVSAICRAFLMEGNSGFVGVRYIDWLCFNTQLRFLSACSLRFGYDPTVDAAITVIRDHLQQIRPNRSKSSKFKWIKP
jgi:hypothetical protein